MRPRIGLSDIATIVMLTAAAAAANLLVNHYAPTQPLSVLVIGAAFVGFELVGRDRLHLRFEGAQLILAIGTFIVLGAIVTWLVNRDAGDVALYSVLGFVGFAVTDSVAFAATEGMNVNDRIDISNIAGAAADSVIFLGGVFGWSTETVLLMCGQTFAKIAGGVIWRLALRACGLISVTGRAGAYPSRDLLARDA